MTTTSSDPQSETTLASGSFNTEMQLETFIRRCCVSTTKAIDAIRNGNLARKEMSAEIRELALSFNEDYNQLNANILTFDEQVHEGRQNNALRRQKEIKKTEQLANRVINSKSFLSEMDVLEKKTKILKESLLALLHDYYEYEKAINLDEIEEEVKEADQRIKEKENDLINSMITDPNKESPANILKNTVEALLGLTVKDFALKEEARQLANDMIPFRDAALNGNLLAMVGIQAPQQPIGHGHGSSYGAHHFDQQRQVQLLDIPSRTNSISGHSSSSILVSGESGTEESSSIASKSFNTNSSRSISQSISEKSKSIKNPSSSSSSLWSN